MSQNRTILQQLFQGELYPAETINNPELQKISNVTNETRPSNDVVFGLIFGGEKYAVISGEITSEVSK